jgi:hypothetical protein
LNVFRMNMLGAKVGCFILRCPAHTDLLLGHTRRVRFSYFEGCRQ